jgi:hypothetical protein
MNTRGGITTPWSSQVHPDTRRAGALRIIARRCDFPEGPAKRPDLADVLFSGGLLRHGDGTATLFTGLSDAEAGYLRMDDPMAPFEAEGGGTAQKPRLGCVNPC